MAGARRGRYEGNWKNGRKHGKGTYTYAGGGQFVGEVLGPQIPLSHPKCTGIWARKGPRQCSSQCSCRRTRALTRDCSRCAAHIVHDPRVTPRPDVGVRRWVRRPPADVAQQARLQRWGRQRRGAAWGADALSCRGGSGAVTGPERSRPPGAIPSAF